MWERRGAYRGFMGRTDGKRPTRKVQAYIVDNIKMDLQDIVLRA
jgi:hypothetical protein